MDLNSNRYIGFEQASKSFLNDQSSGIRSVSQQEKIKGSSLPSVDTGTSFFGSGRNQFISVAQNIGFRGNLSSWNQRNYNVGVIENQGNMVERFDSLVCYPSGTGFFEQEPNLSCFGSGNFKEIVSPFVATSIPLSDYKLSDHSGTDGKNGVVAFGKENGKIADDPANQDPPSSGKPNVDHTLDEISEKKRKKTSECHTPRSNSQFDVLQSTEIGQSKDFSYKSNEASIEKDGKKQKNEQNSSLNTKETTVHSQNADAAEEDCVHVRARRGQATNSHSLAERVRREKISERMKFLQDLVPGCSKVTGKAVMLDEIINYVQSLQRQVEFLSMKLATVNPDLNFDIDQILTNDIIHSSGDGSTALRFAPAVSSHHPRFLEPLLGGLEAKMTNSHIENSGGFPTSLNSQLLTMDQVPQN